MGISRKDFLKILGFGFISPEILRGRSLRAEEQKKVQKTKEEAKKLRIKDIEIYYFTIPMVKPFRIAIGVMEGAYDVLIRIHTDQGIVGVGEACPFPPITGETQETNISVAKVLRENLIGKDPLKIEGIFKDFGTFVHTNPSIIAAFDMALYDILGKVADLPLYRLLGGDRNSFETDLTVDLDTPEKMAVMAKEVINKGYKIIKIKVGQDPSLDIERLSAVRESVGYKYPIRIDANQGWNVPQAIEALRKMEKFDIQFCEQPVPAWNIEGMRIVRNETPIPIMADESLFSPMDAVKLIKAEACDYFNIKLMKSGGIKNGMKISNIAESAGIKCMVGSMLESKVALTAASHLVASSSNIIFADLDADSSHAVYPVIDGIKVEGGTITLFEKPGLGLDVDPSFLKKLRKV
ncbi:MAG: mandelate racemase/muconate lactonizing enzyme family protein [Candidatus Aminicenantia bacterium]